ncbi:hypothetical protein [Robbsia sp. KACC 23696]|uniref:hypothetical protein n=1 Tax=Robbsia sp. KACC 23696 TaxID=3149231 RepID=UPI00325B5388
MSFSLSTMAAAIASISTIATSAVTLASTTVTVAETIYKYGAEMITAAESAYDAQTGAGASKKAAVMAALQAFVTALGEDWSKMASELSSWIDMVIAAWKSAVALVQNIGTTAAATATADAATTVAAAATPAATTADVSTGAAAVAA